MESREKDAPLSQTLESYHNHIKSGPALERQNRLFFEEYKTICRNGVQIFSKINELIELKNRLLTKITQLESKTDRKFADKFRHEAYQKKEKHRRPSEAIERVNHCEVPGCTKSYGTLGSMLQHMRLKHCEYYTERKQRKKCRDTQSFSQRSTSS